MVNKLSLPSKENDVQNKINEIIDNLGGSPSFATITGEPTDNANLATALNDKYDASNPNGYTSNVGTVTSVNNTSPDGNGNVTLSIPAAQINSDWDAVSGVAQILNKPSLATVATSGSYNDLNNKPTIPTDTSDLTNGAGYITGITSSDVTTALGYTPANNSAVANINLSNVSSTGKRTACNWFLPSTSTASVTLGTSGTSYTASESGYIYVTLSRSAAGWALAISVESVLLSKGTTNNNNNTNSVVAWVPVKKGQSFTINYSGQTSISCYIVKCGGVA